MTTRKENESNPKVVFMDVAIFKLRTIMIYNMFKFKVELNDVHGVHPCLMLDLEDMLC